jgi:hypothetical protein
MVTRDDRVELNIFVKIKWIGLGRNDEFLGQEGETSFSP